MDVWCKNIVILDNKQKRKELQQAYEARVLTLMVLIELPKTESNWNNCKDILTTIRK